MLRCPSLVALALAVLGLAGCHHRAVEADDVPATEAEALASDAMDSSEATSRGVALSRLFFVSLDPVTIRSPQKAFDRVLGSGAQLDLLAGLAPIKCVKAAAGPSSNTIRLTFDGCHGPLGIAHLSGALDGTFLRVDGNALETHITSQAGLTANGAPLDYHAESYASIEGGNSDLTLHSSWSGVTRKGHQVEHTSDLSVLMDLGTRCVDISGTTRGTVDGRTTETLIDGYRACPRQCPDAGSITSTSKKNGKSVVVRYDGSNVARVTTAKGNEIAVPLVCDLDG
jgi:hypothetical protein